MSFGQRRLSSLMARFAAEHPHLRVSLLLDDKETDVIEAGVDLVLRIAYPTDSSYIAKPIAPVPRHLCASPDYLATKGTPTKPADLLQHDCLHYNVISEVEERTFDGHAGSVTVAVKGSFCSNNGDVLLQAALEGLGITLLPEFIDALAGCQGRLVRILKKRERAPLTLFALYPSREFVPVKTRLFIDYIIGAIH
jgi:DNA-binding transcriptional LysR family regulator